MRRKNIKSKAILKVESFDLKNVILRQPEIVDNFCQECTETSDGKQVVRIVDPVHVLLNQDRLNSTLGNTAVQNFIDSFRNQKVDPFAELKKQCSVDDLKAMIKSRHLQSPAEVLSWAKYMQSNMELFTSEVQKLIAAQQPQTTAVSEIEKTE